MRVFSLTTGADTAGIGVALANAFRGSGDIRFRAMVATINYIAYPTDLAYSRRRLEVYYDRADVVMLHNTLHGHDWYDFDQGKPTILMHHGRTPMEPFLEQVAKANAIGAVQVGSTMDLTVYAPVEWLPPPVDIAAMQRIRAKAERSHTLRIGHAPTNRDLKGTDAFLAAMASLSKRYDVDAVLIERMSWRECLAQKATVDVLYDQSVLGYGSNAIEAWAMGIPVLAGVEDSMVRAAMLDRWGRLPFLETSEVTLESDLERIIIDRALLTEYARIGSAHVERWHSQPAVVERLTEVLRRARATTPGGRAKLRRLRRRQPTPCTLTTGADMQTLTPSGLAQR